MPADATNKIPKRQNVQHLLSCERDLSGKFRLLFRSVAMSLVLGRFRILLRCSLLVGPWFAVVVTWMEYAPPSRRIALPFPHPGFGDSSEDALGFQETSQRHPWPLIIHQRRLDCDYENRRCMQKTGMRKGAPASAPSEGRPRRDGRHWHVDSHEGC